MKIYLFLEDRVAKYFLPGVKSGSYTFDPDNSEYKLINVEAREKNWVMYTTSFSKVLVNNALVSDTILEPNKYYGIMRDNKNYLIYTTDLYEKTFNAYSLLDLNFKITSDNSGNVIYNNEFLKDFCCDIVHENGSIFLKSDNYKNIYINHMACNKNIVELSFGDTVQIYALKLILLKELLFINDGEPNVSIKAGDEKIKSFSLSYVNNKAEVEIRDEDLYKKNDYFLKSPRFRRMIVPKEIKISAPPALRENQELPFILTLGPMVTMGAMSAVSAVNMFSNIASGQATVKESTGQIISCAAMLASSFLWPLATNFYNKHMQKKYNKKVVTKFNKYLDYKKKELSEERLNQSNILLENLLKLSECEEIIKRKNNGFWDKRIDQNDFLTLRLGIGSEYLKVHFDYPKEEFLLDENKLKNSVDNLIEEFKYIPNCPIGYSFFENNITAIMGTNEKTKNLINNLILQLIAYYSYDDIKIVMFTSEKNLPIYNYVKYLNHSFNEYKNFRFFSSDPESAKELAGYLSQLVDYKISLGEPKETEKPYYVIIADGYDTIKRFDFVKKITECSFNPGFSLIIREERFGNLPSKCFNFINIDAEKSSILKNSYEKQEITIFQDELSIKPNSLMQEYAKIVANVPIESEDAAKNLPEAINFMEMEQVGKVEQLNILNRWQSNDSTISLRSEVGVDENGELMYLDLHEKYHGPHGLIAGTTGSGKSEFIITYILSMCINYSPNDIAFILIDYKGGGLAGAFENPVTNIVLPHLVGTITNLDKAEMDRTLVSIDSEVKRRQKLFNEARDNLGESTIDIYKYQKFYKEGKLELPIPHLFIICDEFAELKAQQPDFMDNLISVARIGRSLGVHLILATQKPSGVVNDQIWSNTKFRVCLKVQDEQDSREMLKRPEAASLKQAGRFYLQVGMDEYFALGQSAWCGAKYFPSNEIVKEADKSVNFINENGIFIKSVKASSKKSTAQGEQITAILKNIIEVAEETNIKATRLWLENIKPCILVENVEKKYSVEYSDRNIKALIGEYDAPELQQQGIVLYDYLKNGNTIIYGNDGTEREMLLHSIIYSTCKNYTAEDINFYIIDYGSENLRIYEKFPQVGGIVFASDAEKYRNLFKLLSEETRRRKSILSNYGGSFAEYIRTGTGKMSIITVILNNYDSMYDANQSLYDELPDYLRDSERYGIVYILTANTTTSVHSKISQNFNNFYAFKLKDANDYTTIFGIRNSHMPRDIMGRGMINNGGLHEFQTASIVEDSSSQNDFLRQFIKDMPVDKVAPKIPVLPETVSFGLIKDHIKNYTNVPVGISKKSLEIVEYDMKNSIGNIITSMKLVNAQKFIVSLLYVLNQIPNTNNIIIDATGDLKLNRELFKNYYDLNLENVLDNLTKLISDWKNNDSDKEGTIFIYGISKLAGKDNLKAKFEKLCTVLKSYEKVGIIISDDANKIRKFQYESWYSDVFTGSSGIWVGKGISDQNIFQLSRIDREMSVPVKNDMAYLVIDGEVELFKTISIGK